MKKFYFLIGIEGSGHYMVRDIISRNLTTEDDQNKQLIYDLKHTSPNLCNFLNYLRVPTHADNQDSKYRFDEFYSYKDGLLEFQNLIETYDSFYLDYSFPFNIEATRQFSYPSLTAIYEFLLNFSEVKMKIIFTNRNIINACKSTIKRGHNANKIVSAYTSHFSLLEVIHNYKFVQKLKLEYTTISFEKLSKKEKSEISKLESFLNIDITENDLLKIKQPKNHENDLLEIDEFFSNKFYEEIT